MRLFDLLPFPWPGIRVCDIEISYMGKNYGNPDLMHVKKDSSFTGSYLYARVIFYVRRIGLYLNKYRIYGTISTYILKGLAFVYQLI